MLRRTLLAVLIVFSTAVAGIAGDPHPLVGTWKKVAARDNKDGAWRPMPEKYSMIKHITPTHVSWAVFRNDTKEVVMTMGGRVAIEGKAYAETVEYGLGNVLNLLNTRQTFTWRIEENCFFQAGTLTNGAYLEEKYERVLPEKDEERSTK
jgi:hypothetical protein